MPTITEFFNALADVGLYGAKPATIRHELWRGKYSVTVTGMCWVDPVKLAAVIALFGLEGASLEICAETVWDSGFDGDTSRVCPEVTLRWTNDIKLGDAPSAQK